MVCSGDIKLQHNSTVNSLSYINIYFVGLLKAVKLGLQQKSGAILKQTPNTSFSPIGQHKGQICWAGHHCNLTNRKEAMYYTNSLSLPPISCSIQFTQPTQPCATENSTMPNTPDPPVMLSTGSHGGPSPSLVSPLATSNVGWWWVPTFWKQLDWNGGYWYN